MIRVKKETFKFKKSCFLLFLLCFFFLAGVDVMATSDGKASMFLSPASVTHSVGDSFSISVKIDAGGEKINAAEGNLIFNPDELFVSAIYKTNSVFNLWTTEPKFSNSEGTINFGGGTTADCCQSLGTIIAIRFNAKKISSTSVSFSSGSVLAADGLGTNILSSMIGGAYTIEPKIITPTPKPTPTPAPTPSAKVPTAPIISSSTHSDPDKWYSDSNPKLSWTMPSDITAIKTLLNRSSGSTPAVLYSTPISEKNLEDLDDGTWYFHLMYKNQYGWGKITHRKILIDTELPNPFKIKVDNGGDPSNPSPKLSFMTTDSTSGIDHYELQIDQNDPVMITAEDGKKPFITEAQDLGGHTIIVKAVDGAFNYSSDVVNINIEPLEEPKINFVSSIIKEGEPLVVRGSSEYPDAIVHIFIKYEDKSEYLSEGASVFIGIEKTVSTDSEGDWIFTHDEILPDGVYTIFAKLVSNNGAKSDFTEKETVVVSAYSFVELVMLAIDPFTVITVLVICMILVSGVALYHYSRLSILKKYLRKETSDVARNVSVAFKALRAQVKEEIKELNGKPKLTKKEKKLADNLKKALDMSQKFINKEIRDIEKKLE